MRPLNHTLLFAVALALAAPAAAAPHGQLGLQTLSNRADLISGGDALVEVLLPADVAPASVRVSVDGRDVTGAFAVRANGRYMGLVTGLALGPNTLLAQVVTPAGSGRPPGREAAHLTVTNHARGGPVFAGAQMQPWICARMVSEPVTVTVPGTSLSAVAMTRVSGLASNPVDEQCNAATRYTYYYQPKAREGTACTFTNTGANRCFEPYPAIEDPATRPLDADIADFTNDRGVTVKSLVRVERGAMNRGIYELVSFYDPLVASAPWAPQPGWNGKLLWRFGAASAYSRFQTPPGTSVWNHNALVRGYMVASASLTDHNTNANDTLGAEAMMMAKEHIVDTYGEIRYTIGDGASGGAIYQHQLAAAYPGLLNGLQPGISYPDTFTTGIEVTECGLLQDRYYGTRSLVELPATLRAAINGHLTTNFCAVWISSFLARGNPTLAGNCGGGFPTALTYDPVLRPDGVRCTGADHSRSILGTFPDTDGNTKSPSPFDNEGVQYGLKALQSGVLSPEEFVRLNEGVGSYTMDQGWIPPARKVASNATLRTVYTSGIVSDGRQLAKAAIIDLRSSQNPNGDIHMNWRSWSLRERLDKANGHHDNQVIFAAVGFGAALTLKAFTTLDAWLAGVEADTSGLPVEEKIVRNKPAGTVDICLTTNGATDEQVAANVGLGTPECPVVFQSSPRQVAGGPLSEDVFKCQLKPLNFSDADYNGAVFTPEQQARLVGVFTAGVCDWSRPGVEQAPANPWTTFADGPGGRPLGDAPQSIGGCPGFAAGVGNAAGDGCPGGSAGR
ncbi:MAG TPA: DUF6351 family protein [Burkholderiales bacterium]|nr:DUF6351 family protein [Burkholderiales bacterium]